MAQPNLAITHRMSETNYWEQIEEAFDTVDIYGGEAAFKDSAAKYPAWKIDLLAIHWTMREITNGGLSQYFDNPTAVLAPEAVTGFINIGAPELAEALSSAMALLGAPYPRAQEIRQQRIAALTGAEPAETSSPLFSLIPKWVQDEVGMKSDRYSINPFASWEKLLEDAAGKAEAACDLYAVMKSKQPA